MRNAEEASAEQLSRTPNSKPTRTSGLTARFPRPDAQPAEKTRIPQGGVCSRTLDLFEEAVLAIVHHLRSKSRMHMKFASGNRSQPKGRSLLHVRISLGSIAVLQIQKLYFVENWIVLAGPAALALPKSGELTTPMMLVTFV